LFLSLLFAGSVAMSQRLLVLQEFEECISNLSVCLETEDRKERAQKAQDGGLLHTPSII